MLSVAASVPPLTPSPPAPSLARVARGELCAGCGACAALAPGQVEMALSEPGFPRPLQRAPLDPLQDRAIARACPGLGQRVAAAGRLDSTLWGPHVAMRTGWATDPEVRHAGASGGALSAILLHLLAEGIVDAAIETGADPLRPTGNAPALAIDRAGVLAAAGSRYAPSSPLAELGAYRAQHRATGRRFAFVGKPCDAVAMAELRAMDPEVAAAVPVVLSFFCAGVPSARGAARLLAAMGAEEARVTTFRYRGQGWPGRATATLDDGTARSMGYHESWGQVLSRHLQHRCKICADGTGMAADIVCADAWESDAAGYPLFEEAPGVSLIVSRTALGERIVAAAAAAGRIATEPFDAARLAAMQPGQRDRRQALLARLAAQRLVGRPAPRYRGLHLAAAAWQAGLRRNAQGFMGMLQRLRRRPPEAGPALAREGAKTTGQGAGGR